MENLAGATGKMSSSFSFEALKEPRGFIRIIEFILAIFAFATVCSFNSEVTFTIACNKTEKYVIKYSYPFDLPSKKVEITECDETKKVHSLSYGPKSPAEFYVFVGVMAMLYTLCAFVLYVFFDDLYRKNNRIIVGDFIVTVLWAFLWLVSSSVWAQGVVDLKFYTDPSNGFFSGIHRCTVEPTACKAGSAGNFAGVNVSVIFGFLNAVVWGGNCWFLWKETPWFKKSEEDYIPDPGTVRQPTPDPNSPAPLY